MEAGHVDPYINSLIRMAPPVLSIEEQRCTPNVYLR